MNASTAKAVGAEIVWPVRMRAKIVKKVAVGLAINEKHSMIDNKALFLRIIQTSLLQRKPNSSVILHWVYLRQ